MSNEPVRNTVGTRTRRITTNIRNFNGDDGYDSPNLSTNPLKRSLISRASFQGRQNNHQNRRYRNDSTSSSNLNFSPNFCSEKKDILVLKNSRRLNMNGAEDAENICDEAANVDGCSVAGLKPSGSSPTFNPEYKADIVSKLKSKAIGNLLFKAREDINVKKLNEMKTRPEKVAEDALLLCDLKSYKGFVDELFSSGVFPVYKERRLILENGRNVDYETKKYAARKEMENLERMAGRVFGEDFLHRNNNHHQNNNQNGFFEINNWSSRWFHCSHWWCTLLVLVS